MKNSSKEYLPYNGLYWIVEDAEYVEEFKIKVWFRDGSIKIVDFRNRLFNNSLGEMLEPLKNIEVFNKVKYDIDASTIVFPNGADIAPEWLYENGVELETDISSTLKTNN
jgi:uncharacterized protein YnzC (UPF0291/DUF896 family)